MKDSEDKKENTTASISEDQEHIEENTELDSTIPISEIINEVSENPQKNPEVDNSLSKLEQEKCGASLIDQIDSNIDQAEDIEAENQTNITKIIENSTGSISENEEQVGQNNEHISTTVVQDNTKPITEATKLSNIIEKLADSLSKVISEKSDKSLIRQTDWNIDQTENIESENQTLLLDTNRHTEEEEEEKQHFALPILIQNNLYLDVTKAIENSSKSTSQNEEQIEENTEPKSTIVAEDKPV